MNFPMLRVLRAHRLRIEFRCRQTLRLQSTNGYMRFMNEGPETLLCDSMKIQVVGNGAQGFSKSVLLNIHNTKILFNCGESTDYGFKGMVNAVYVTHLDWCKMGGLLGLIYKATSSNRDHLLLCGPPGLGTFMEAAERFLLVHNFNIRLLDCDNVSQNLENNFLVKCIPIYNKFPKTLDPSPIDKSWFKCLKKYPKNVSAIINESRKEQVDLNTSYSYICRTESSKAWVLSQCTKRGLKPGENMLKLWAGNEVVLDDGSLIQPDDVIRTENYHTVIVIDCPSEGYLDDLLQKKDYEEFYEINSQNEIVIIHFTPVVIMHDERYISWMKRFPQNTRHLIINESNLWNNSDRVINRHEVCRLISSRFFPKLRSHENNIFDNFIPHTLHNANVIVKENVGPTVREERSTDSWLKQWSAKLQEFNLIQSWNGTLINLKSLKVIRCFDVFDISDVPGKSETYFERPPPASPQNPKVTFLGTSSQGSSQHRNTSGIFIELSDDCRILLDCGDGIINRLTALYDKNELPKVLASIRLIYISHTHADHHAGLVGILRAIKTSRRESKEWRTILLLPPPLLEWLEDYHTKLESILDDITLLNLSEMITNAVQEKSQLYKLLNKTLGIKRLSVCWANHCAFSYCVSISHETGWKISYSGDTEYSKHFIRIGKHSDLLIHEATFASGLNKLASRSRHSTTDDALRVGTAMGAKCTILTHFSRRYPVLPCMSDLKNTSNVTVAFDFLQVSLADLKILTKLNAAYELVFKEYSMAVEEERSQILKKTNHKSQDDSIESDILSILSK